MEAPGGRLVGLGAFFSFVRYVDRLCVLVMFLRGASSMKISSSEEFAVPPHCLAADTLQRFEFTFEPEGRGYLSAMKVKEHRKQPLLDLARYW